MIARGPQQTCFRLCYVEPQFPERTFDLGTFANHHLGDQCEHTLVLGRNRFGNALIDIGHPALPGGLMMNSAQAAINR